MLSFGIQYFPFKCVRKKVKVKLKKKYVMHFCTFKKEALGISFDKKKAS